MKDWNKLEPDEYRIIGKHYSKGRAGHKIRKVVIHHNAGNLSIQDCFNVWQTREASAHYQVDSAGRIGQLVHDWDTAWHAGNLTVNRESIGIEHADISSSPWRVSDATLDNGAHLVAAICRAYGLGRPVWGVNVFPHKQFSSTACPASLAGDQRDAYMSRSQFWYDQMVGAAPAAPAPAPAAQGIAEDGWWGEATNRLLQQRLGTPADGVISHQWAPNRSRLPAATSGWEWDLTGKGSLAIAALQRKLGVVDDGLIGRDTINALERRAGFNPDGRLDGPSNTVRWLQHALNTNSL